MKSNYEPLGKHIQLVDYRNSEEVTSTVLGISIDKEFKNFGPTGSVVAVSV